MYVEKEPALQILTDFLALFDKAAKESQSLRTVSISKQDQYLQFKMIDMGPSVVRIAMLAINQISPDQFDIEIYLINSEEELHSLRCRINNDWPEDAEIPTEYIFPNVTGDNGAKILALAAELIEQYIASGWRYDPNEVYNAHDVLLEELQK